MLEPSGKVKDAEQVKFSTPSGLRRAAVFLTVSGALLAAGYRFRHARFIEYLEHRILNQYTVGDRLAQFGQQARLRWSPYFAAAGVAYPPRQVLIAALKREKILLIYAQNPAGAWKEVRKLPILGASGKAGPKLKEGDLQVPEGIYRIESLNPNSSFHVSLRVNYPNDFDRAMASAEGRSDLGSDIMIHGSSGSIGCLAMGDVAAEDLFVLAADSGLPQLKVVLCPLDLRVHPIPTNLKYKPVWLPGLYAQLQQQLAALPPS